MKLPVKFPHDPYCRALSRIMLTVDKKTKELYLGITPDGVSVGRDMLSKITAWAGDQPLLYTCSIEDNQVVLKTDKGSAHFTIALPDRLIVEAYGISLMLGSGKTSGLFMGGGSAVDDAADGALYVTSGVRLRVIARTGKTQVRSAWDLDALSDPNPQLYLLPAEDGVLTAVIFASDFDETFTDDGIKAADAAADIAQEFNAFLNELAVRPQSENELHAAYVIWTALQPARVLNEQRITVPEYVDNRRTNGTAMQYDNVLIAAFLKDTKTAAEYMCSFLKYQQADGQIPSEANNRMFLLESVVPLFGVVFAARPELCNAITGNQYDSMKKAISWWQNERFCSVRQLFYYLHRYEPGCGNKLPFADIPPEFAPELNTYMVLWLEAMSKIAENLGIADDKAELGSFATEVINSMKSRLWNGNSFICINIENKPVCEGHPCAAMPSLLTDKLPAFDVHPEVPDVYALPLLLAAPDKVKFAVKKAVHNRTDKYGIYNLKQAMLILAATI